MLKFKIFSTRYGGRAFDIFCDAMGDKIKKIENVNSETDGHIAWRVTYEDDDPLDKNKVGTQVPTFFL